MTPEEYIESLQRTKQLAVDRFGNLSEIERQFVDASFEWMVSNIDLKKGEFQVTEDLPGQMSEFVNAVLNILNRNKDYENKLSDYLSDITKIDNVIQQFHSTYNQLDLSGIDLSPTQKGITGHLLNEFLVNGLNAGFAEPLKDVMYNNIVAGMNVRDAKDYLNDYVRSGKDKTGKLGKYITQTAQMGVDAYSGALNSRIANLFTFTGLIISGSLIETSSEQCIYAVEHADKNGYLPNQEWEHILSIARDNKKAQLIEGTNLKNLSYNKLHWGCRHDFTPSLKN